MKRSTVFVFMLALGLAAAAMAAGQTKRASANTTKETTPKTATVTGEIVDMGCYLSSGARGEQHKDCATMCLNNGMPMGLLTNDGKLYLLTLNHDNADPYNSAKKMASERVSVTGPISERNGVRSLTVNEVKEATTTAAAPAKKG